MHALLVAVNGGEQTRNTLKIQDKIPGGAAETWFLGGESRQRHFCGAEERLIGPHAKHGVFLMPSK